MTVRHAEGAAVWYRRRHDEQIACVVRGTVYAGGVWYIIAPIDGRAVYLASRGELRKRDTRGEA